VFTLLSSSIAAILILILHHHWASSRSSRWSSRCASMECDLIYRSCASTHDAACLSTGRAMREGCRGPRSPSGRALGLGSVASSVKSRRHMRHMTHAGSCTAAETRPPSLHVCAHALSDLDSGKWPHAWVFPYVPLMLLVPLGPPCASPPRT
jgi:hypothetical protein